MRQKSQQKKGRQKPTFSVVSNFYDSGGEGAIELASGYGLIADEWQADILNAWLSGKWVHDTKREKAYLDKVGEHKDIYKLKLHNKRVGASVPRQNGKNVILIIFVLFALLILGLRIIFTAHEVKTAREMFLMLANYLDNEEEYPELYERVESVRRANGQEGIKLINDPARGWNGGEIVFSARSRGAARGFSADVVILDEAQELTEEQQGALMPTLAAAKNDRLLIFTGTPPYPGCQGDVFKRMYDKAHSGELPNNNCWHEWAVEDANIDIENRDYWYLTNPALNIRLDEEWTEQELVSLNKETFLRERLGYWTPNEYKGEVVFDTESWKQREITNNDKQLQLLKKKGYISGIAVKFSPDNLTYSIAGARKYEDDTRLCELIAYNNMAQKGIGWLVNWIIERIDNYEFVLVDGLNAQALCEQLQRAQVEMSKILMPRTSDFITATATFITDVKNNDGEDAVKILIGANETLYNAALNCTKRKIGRDGGFGYNDSACASATTIEAISLAYWKVISINENEQKKESFILF